jgi:hypothetical protein
LAGCVKSAFQQPALPVKGYAVPKIGNIALTGKSGRQYSFEVFARTTEFRAVGAVYLQSKRTPTVNGGGSHDFIYIGQTSNLSDRPLNHHKKACFDREAQTVSLCIWRRTNRSG